MPDRVPIRIGGRVNGLEAFMPRIIGMDNASGTWLGVCLWTAGPRWLWHAGLGWVCTHPEVFPFLTAISRRMDVLHGNARNQLLLYDYRQPLADHCQVGDILAASGGSIQNLKCLAAPLGKLAVIGNTIKKSNS